MFLHQQHTSLYHTVNLHARIRERARAPAHVQITPTRKSRDPIPLSPIKELIKLLDLPSAVDFCDLMKLSTADLWGCVRVPHSNTSEVTVNRHDRPSAHQRNVV